MIARNTVLLAAGVLISTTEAFAPVAQNSVKNTALDAYKMYYSTSTGNTETIAGYIAEYAGISDFEDIGDATDSDVTGCDGLIVGAPTWHTGADEQRSGTSWDDWLYDTLPNLDLDGKKVAIFGVGDQQSYGDNFCDAAGELYDLFSAKGCKVFGLTSQDGYDHGTFSLFLSLIHCVVYVCIQCPPFFFFISRNTMLYLFTKQTPTVESKAVKDGKFCGLMCDEDNQYDMSDDRAKSWVAQLKDEGFM
jgi:flavodoxin I